MTKAHLFGMDESNMTELAEFKVHKKAVKDFIALKEKAKLKGFEMTISSSYRSYEQQKSIWNAKASGKRTLLDDEGKALEFDKLSKKEVLHSILRWSALPGASRHHWGTELDVYDRSSLPHPNYEIELSPIEVKGIFAPFYNWLDDEIFKNESMNFFRPYDQDLGGVAVEKWHLSYAPVSEAYMKDFRLEDLRSFITKQDDLLLKDFILAELDEIFEKYILNISPPPF